MIISVCCHAVEKQQTTSKKPKPKLSSKKFHNTCTYNMINKHYSSLNVDKFTENPILWIMWHCILVGATNVLQAATGNLLDVKDRMEVKGLHRQMDNKARERHHLTIQDLREIQRVSVCHCIIAFYAQIFMESYAVLADGEIFWKALIFAASTSICKFIVCYTFS